MHAELRLIIGRLDDCAATVHNGLAEADWTSKRDLIRALVKRVEVAQNEVNIVFRVDPYAGDADPEKKSWQLCRGSDDAPLWCPGQGFSLFPFFHHTCAQEFPEKVSDVPVCYPFLYRLDEPPVRYFVKGACSVAFYYPLIDFSGSPGESVRKVS